MILYHNADINDLNSICERGLLPLSITRNDHWNSGKRADNSIDAVYLFNPIAGQSNSFTNYGAALIEVDTKAEKSEMLSSDRNFGKYEEYTTGVVLPEQIIRIFIPIIFKDRIGNLSETTLSKIVWCDIKANTYNHDLEKIVADEKILIPFADTARIDVEEFNYFRGQYPNREMIDLYDIQYIFE